MNEQRMFFVPETRWGYCPYAAPFSLPVGGLAQVEHYFRVKCARHRHRGNPKAFWRARQSANCIAHVRALAPIGGLVPRSHVVPAVLKESRELGSAT